MSDDLIAAHADEAKLMPYLHLPFQAGSDRILAAMNRKHTAGDYLALVARIRAAQPDIALSTDIIVGFPGETDAEFEETLALVRRGRVRAGLLVQVQPAPRHARREARRSGARRGEVERLARLQELLDGQQAAFNGECVGRILPVLFERPGRHAGPARRPLALPAGRARRGGAGARRPDLAG